MPTPIKDRVADLKDTLGELEDSRSGLRRGKRLAWALWLSALLLVPLLSLLVVVAWSKWQASHPPARPASPPPSQLASPKPARPAHQQAEIPEAIRNTSVEQWFGRLGRDAELGDAPFTAMNALTVKATEGEAVRDQIIKQAIETLGSPRQDFLKRWQCCYVLSGIRDPRGIAPTARALKDPNTILRDVAACALGQYDHPDARSALHAAARTERDPKVRETIAKALQ